MPYVFFVHEGTTACSTDRISFEENQTFETKMEHVLEYSDKRLSPRILSKQLLWSTVRTTTKLDVCPPIGSFAFTACRPHVQQLG